MVENWRQHQMTARYAYGIAEQFAPLLSFRSTRVRLFLQQTVKNLPQHLNQMTTRCAYGIAEQAVSLLSFEDTQAS
jgi:hypothetical protein